MTTTFPSRIPDGTAVRARREHFAGRCDGIVTAAEYDDGWLYRVEVTKGDRLDAERDERGELWLCDFEVQPIADTEA